MFPRFRRQCYWLVSLFPSATCLFEIQNVATIVELTVMKLLHTSETIKGTSNEARHRTLNLQVYADPSERLNLLS